MSSYGKPSLQALQGGHLYGGDEESPKLWPPSQPPAKAGPKPKKSADDLYSLYETMGNGTDLTLKDMCGHFQQKRDDHQAVKAARAAAATAVESNLDFAEGLAAVQSAMATHALSEAEEGGGQEKKPEAAETRRIRHRDGSEVWQNRKGSASFTEGGGCGAGEGGVVKECRHKASRRGGPQKGNGGAPHTKYCCICNKLALFLKTRCLVCGRCYCISCVKVGMGSMPEGRKCRSCLGHRFSERYINRAGKAWLNISSEARMAEIKWAKKGPHRRDTPSNSRRQENFSLSSPYHSPCHRPQLSPRCSPQVTPPRSPFGDFTHQNMNYAFV